MSEIPEVFAIFEQKLAHVLSFTVVPSKIKDLKNALEEILTYFSGIVERASKAESRIVELEKQLYEEKLLLDGKRNWLARPQQGRGGVMVQEAAKL